MLHPNTLESVPTTVETNERRLDIPTYVRSMVR